MLTALNNEEGSGLRLGLFFLEWAGENSRCRMVTSKEAFSARPAASRPGPARPAPPRARAEDGSLHHPPRQSAGGPGLRAQLQHRRRSGRDSRVQGGWKERQTEASTREARPDGQHPDSKRLSPCNSEAHRSGLPRCHWFPRTRPGSGQRRDRPRQLPPEPRGPSPPLGPSRGADQAARSGPPAPRTHRRRPPSSPGPPPLSSRSLPPPGHAARWPRALPPSGPRPGLLLSSPGRHTASTERFRAQKDPPLVLTAQAQFSCALAFPEEPGPVFIRGTQELPFTSNMLCHQDHFLTYKEAGLS